MEGKKEKVRWVELGEVCEFRNGVVISPEDHFLKPLDSKFKPLLKIANLQREKFRFK